MISFKNVSYSYRNGSGVTNINFNLDPGEFTFLIGPTGSGKTTIMKLIYMDLYPDSGKIVILGTNVAKLKRRKIPFLRRRIGMIFQDYHLLNDRNLFENVAIPLHIIGIPRNEVEERVYRILEEVGLTNKEKQYPEELSGGEQQRACIARALIKDPEIILADEPTGNLDPIASFELVNLLEQINREGTAILMASHNYNLIKGRGHPIIEMRDGKLRNG